MTWQNQVHNPHDSETAFVVADKAFNFASEITIPANTTVNLNLSTSDKDVLIQYVEVGSLQTECEVIGFAGSTIADNGILITGKTANMRYRGDDTIQSTVSIYSEPTILNDGKRMTVDIALGDLTGTHVTPAKAGLSGQFILQNNTNNVFRLTNRNSNTDTSASIKIRWVEDYI